MSSVDATSSRQFFAAARAGDCDELRRLIDGGMDVTTRVGKALMLAAAAGHVEAVQLLKSLGANINIARRSGYTALMAAVMGNKYDVVVELLSTRGIDVRMKNKHGKTARELAMEKHYSDIARVLREYEEIRFRDDGEVLADTWEVRSAGDGGVGPADHVGERDGNGGVGAGAAAASEIVNTLNDRGETALIRAAALGRVGAVRRLLLGADINIASESGYTALMAAVMGNRYDVVVELLSTRGIDVRRKNKDGKTARELAMEKHYSDIARVLREYEAIRFIDDGEVPADTGEVRAAGDGDAGPADPAEEGGVVGGDGSADHVGERYGDGGVGAGAAAASDVSSDDWFRVVREGNIYRIEELLARGMDVNAKNQHGFTALYLEFLRGCMRMVRKLIIHGADVNAVDSDRRTVLHRAVSINDVKELIKCGVNIDAVDSRGQTALHLACLSGKVEIAQELIDRGAKVDLKDVVGRTAAQMARALGHTEIAEKILRYDWFKAIESRNIYRVLDLVEKNIDINMQDESGRNALHLAVLNDDEFAIRLLKIGCWDLNAVDDADQTVLHIAICESRPKVAVELLSRENLNVDVCDCSGQTALDYVVISYSSRGMKEVFELLLEKGATVTDIMFEEAMCNGDYKNIIERLHEAKRIQETARSGAGAVFASVVDRDGGEGPADASGSLRARTDIAQLRELFAKEDWFEAVRSRNIDRIRELLDKGMDINVVNQDGAVFNVGSRRLAEFS